MPMSAAPDHGASRNVRPLASAWQIFDSECVDLFSIDFEGEPPEGGTPPGGGLGTMATTFDSAYDIQANHADHQQVSGSPDGLCDDNPSQIRGIFATGGVFEAYIGPLNLPRQGWYVVSEWPGKLNQQFVYVDFGAEGMWPELPDSHAFWPFASSPKMPAVLAWFAFGTPYTIDSDYVTPADQAPLPVSRVYLRLRVQQPGAYTVNLAFHTESPVFRSPQCESSTSPSPSPSPSGSPGRLTRVSWPRARRPSPARATSDRQLIARIASERRSHPHP
jgi:hypothetical protein